MISNFCSGSKIVFWAGKSGIPKQSALTGLQVGDEQIDVLAKIILRKE